MLISVHIGLQLHTANGCSLYNQVLTDATFTWMFTSLNLDSIGFRADQATKHSIACFTSILQRPLTIIEIHHASLRSRDVVSSPAPSYTVLWHIA